MATAAALKQGSCGDIRTEAIGGRIVVVRDLRTASNGAGRLARWLAAREARALERLHGTAGVPELIGMDAACLRRTFLPGLPMQQARPATPVYFREALRVLRRLHRHGVAHNDLAKEANWLCTESGEAAIVDFQLAICFRKRNRWFRLLAYEDLRHLLKHKANYCPGHLTTRQRAVLVRPSWLTRIWRIGFKPPYRLITRSLLRWPERNGPEERQRRA